MTDPVLDVVNDLDAVTRLFDIQSTDTVPEYRVQVNRADVVGNVSDDLTDYLIHNDSDHVEWECTANVPGSAGLTLDGSLNLTYGTVIVALFQLVRSQQYNDAHGLNSATWIRFPVGHFVLTTPDTADLDNATKRDVTGYDKNYLLQYKITDSLSFDYGTTYLAAITSVFVAAGLISGTSPALLSVCDYPGVWASKTLPQPRNYPLDGTTTYLDIANALLKESGCRPIYTQPTGRWLVEVIPTVATQPLRWRWFAGDLAAAQEAAVVIDHSCAYSADVWNAPNRWVFIQQGLTFAPAGTDGSGGRYVVDNLNTAPGGQNVIGRIIADTVFLAALGQTELVTQGKAYVQDQLAKAEKINFHTASWPAARHFDVFEFNHDALPGDTRRVQAQKWTLPLWGAPMTWETTAVVQS